MQIERVCDSVTETIHSIMNITKENPTGEQEYQQILQQAVAVLDKARANIAKSIAGNVSNAHWEMGMLLYERKLDAKHGDSVVRRLSADLKKRFPTMGLSPRNLWDMKRFFVRFNEADPKVRQAVALLPWWNTLYLMSKFGDDDNAILYYATENISKGWNRELLTNAVNLEMHKSAASLHRNDNNFKAVLPAGQAEYANEIVRSTYNLGFLGVTTPVLEQELESRIVNRIKQFLLEMGKGFAFIGSQYEIEYKGRVGRIDLLLYHRHLRCLVAIELKAGAYRPEYAGKMNYYLSILDRTERAEGENPSIGIVLCAEKNHVDVELSLDGLDKPIGVSDYKLFIPKDELKSIVQSEIESYSKDNE